MRPISVYEAIRHWDELAVMLLPAVATDTRTLDDVKVGIVTRDMQAWATGRAIIVTATGFITGTSIEALWVLYAAGEATRSEYRELIEELASVARKQNCTKLRLEGCRSHKWARVLGGFEHVSGSGDDAVYERSV